MDLFALSCPCHEALMLTLAACLASQDLRKKASFCQTGQDWSQHYRRWARVVAKKGDWAYWVCLQLAKPDSPFSFEVKHGCKEEVHDPM